MSQFFVLQSANLRFPHKDDDLSEIVWNILEY